MARIAALLTSTLLAGSGLVAMTTAPAQAECPYTACIDTSTTIKVPSEVRKGSRVNVCSTVSAAGGEGQPMGTIRFVVGHSEKTRAYDGGRTCAKFRVTKKVRAQAFFQPETNSVFLPSNSSRKTIRIED